MEAKERVDSLQGIGFDSNAFREQRHMQPLFLAIRILHLHQLLNSRIIRPYMYILL
jgi:hypothetical protein